MSRTQRILGILLIAQVILGAIALWPRQSQAEAGQPLLGQFDPAQATRLVIIDNTGKETILRRSGVGWVLESAGDYPVIDGKVEPVLEKLQTVQTSRLVTRTASSHKRLQVADDDFQRKVTLEFANGTSKEFLLGSSAGSRTYHIRLSGEDEVYLTSEIAATDLATTASSWVDTAFINLTAEQIIGLRLKNANGELAFDKDTEGAWQQENLPAGREIDSSLVDTLVNRLSTLRMAEPLGTEVKPEYGFDQSTLVVEMLVESADGASTQIVTVEVGAFDEAANQYTVRSSQSAYIVRAAGFNLNEAVNADAESFLAPLPTPAP